MEDTYVVKYLNFSKCIKLNSDNTNSDFNGAVQTAFKTCPLPLPIFYHFQYKESVTGEFVDMDESSLREGKVIRIVDDDFNVNMGGMNVDRIEAIVNEESVNKEIENSVYMNEEIVNEETVNEEIVNEETVNEEIVNKEIVNKEIENKEIENRNIEDKENNPNLNTRCVPLSIPNPPPIMLQPLRYV